MQTESIELSFLSIFAFLTFFIFLLVNNYSNKLYNGILLDKDFLKPQAFHDEAISRSGGLASIICLLIFLELITFSFQKCLTNMFLFVLVFF